MAIKKVISVSADTKQAQQEFDLLEKNIKEADDQVLKLERHLLELQKAQSKQGSGSVEYKRLGKEIKKVNLRLKEEKMDLKELKKEKSNNLKITKDQTKATKEQGTSMGLLNKLTGGLAGKMQGAYKSILSATKGMKLLNMAFMASGIGALVIAVVSLMSAFKRSEEGQDMFAKGMAVIGAVVNQIMDLFANFGMAIINAFKNPKEAWEGFKESLTTGFKFLKTQVLDRMSGSFQITGGKIRKGILKLRIEWKKFWGNDDAVKGLQKQMDQVQKSIDDGKDKIKKANDQIKGVYDSAKKSVTGFIDETKKEMAITSNITKMRQNAHKLERQLVVEVAEGRRKINDLRLQAEDREKYSATERIALLREAQGIEDELANKQIKAKKLVISALKQEHAMGLTTKESKDELAKLEAELINLDTKKLRGKRLLQTQITTAINQEKAEKAKQIEEEKAQEQGLVDFKKALREAEANTLAEEHALQLENNNIKFEELQLQLLEQRELGLISEEEFELYKADIQLARKESNDELLIKQSKETADEEKKIAEDKLKEENKIAKSEEKIRQAKLGQAKNLINGLQAIASIGGKKSKALAIAGIVVDQISSASQIISNLGIANAKAVAASPVTAGQPFVALNTVNAVASIAGGLAGAKKAIANLKSSNENNPGSPSPSTSTPATTSVAETSTPEPQSPQFSSIGSAGGNQIAEALASQSPVQAFVVSNDVTSAQSLERNIVNSATIG